MFRKKNVKEAEQVEQEILTMVNEGHEQGAIEASEATMINNIFEFVDKEAGDIATNRSNVVAIDSKTNLIDAMNFMLNSSFSRYPVYDENLDNITGVLYLKDTCRIHARDEALNDSISQVKGLVRKAIFIPETMNINALFKFMQSKKTQLAIVIDEYGQTSGIVTMEDILEEIVGNILDEYDIEEKHIKRTGKDDYLIDGSTALSDIEDRLKIKFDVEDFETLNGFMISKMDRLPGANEVFETNVCGYTFSIVSVENRMIRKVSVKKQIEKEED